MDIHNSRLRHAWRPYRDLHPHAFPFSCNDGTDYVIADQTSHVNAGQAVKQKTTLSLPSLRECTLLLLAQQQKDSIYLAQLRQAETTAERGRIKAA
jgi:hypothetical protein